VPQEQRTLSSSKLAAGLQPGTELPVPQGVFARLERKAE
jgi:methionyl-tRNA synthetase